MDHVSSQFEHDADERRRERRPALNCRSAKRRSLFALALLFVILFASLGGWQVQRRAWKLDLIARVDRRIHTQPQPAPGPAQWASLTRENAEYRHVHVEGRFLNDRETLVRAVTEYGGGYWVVTPLAASWGTVLVNRGFVPAELRSPQSRILGNVDGSVRITGLLRMSEPGGAFLHHNAPADNRWYSRDVASIARSRDLKRAAPYFIDADATPVAGGWPKGGLTVITFRNAHLQYAITWFALAFLSAFGAFLVMRDR
ncbi:MAG TPA: SURF1 family protein [Sphingomicrobium sp.]|nr:SURF1 family protein [Sphingomicrobium sp.]